MNSTLKVPAPENQNLDWKDQGRSQKTRREKSQADARMAKKL